MAQQGNRVGEQFGNYRLVQLLGRGSFAEVYLGQHRRLQRPAALKVLHTMLSEREIDDFQREAQIIAGLDHPNIVRILDFDVQRGVPFLVMDYLPNGTLRQRHPRGERVELATVVSYVQQVAAALQYAHDQRLIHRDIKPENMLIGKRGEIVLNDFGIAAMVQSTASLKEQRVGGTVSYMAPEQIQAQARAASDQYALGIVVYEWLSGERPFEGSAVEIFAKHLMTPPTPLRQKVPTLPVVVEQVILTALAKDPHQRFQSVHAFAEALGQASSDQSTEGTIHKESASAPDALSQSATLLTALWPPELPAREQLTTIVHHASTEVERSPVHTEPSMIITSPPAQTLPTASARGRKHTRRNVLIGLGAAVVGVGAAGGGMFWHTRTLTPVPIHPYTYRGHAGDVYSVAWSPDGQRIASASSDHSVQVMNAADGSHIYRYLGHDNYVTSVAWSPNGQRIASGSLDEMVHVWNAADGSYPYMYRGSSGGVNTVAWSPGGQRIASGNWNATVQIWDATDGGNEYTYNGHTYGINSVAWSPDGRRVASGGRDKTVQVMDATNGLHAYTYRKHTADVYAVAWSPNGKYIASASADGTVRVWDAINGGQMYLYEGHSSLVYTVAWSPDGQHIASGGDDKTVQVWSPTAKGHVYTYNGHTNSVIAVAWSPDGKNLVSGGYDHTVQVWNAQ